MVPYINYRASARTGNNITLLDRSILPIQRRNEVQTSYTTVSQEPAILTIKNLNEELNSVTINILIILSNQIQDNKRRSRGWDGREHGTSEHDDW